MTQIALTTAFGGTIYPEVTQEVFINVAGRDAPITAALMALGRKRVTSTPTIKYKGQDLAVRRTQINNLGGYDENATDMVVDDASIFAIDDLILAESTGETMLVTAVNTGTDTITVQRSFGTTAAAAIADDAYLYNTGPAKIEASTGNEMRAQSTTEYTSYTRIFERTCKLSGTLNASNTQTEDERARLRKEAFMEVSRDIELAALFDEPAEDTTGGDVRRSTQGIMTFALANVADANGTLTEAELDAWLSTLFTRGSDYRLVFGSGDTCGIIRRLKQPVMQANVQDRRVGFTAVRYATPDGEFELIKHPHMVGAFSQELLAIDPDQAEIRNLTDRDLKLYPDVQSSDLDAKKDKWLGELGFTWGNPNAHGRLTNIQQEG